MFATILPSPFSPCFQLRANREEIARYFATRLTRSRTMLLIFELIRRASDFLFVVRVTVPEEDPKGA
jgi:hypothetical protein